MKKKFQDPGTKSIFKIFVATPSSCRASHNKVFSQFLSNTDFVFLMPQVPSRPQDHENRQTHKKITITPEKLGVMTSNFHSALSARRASFGHEAEDLYKGRQRA